MMRSLSTSAFGQPSDTKLTSGAGRSADGLALLGTGRGYRRTVARSSATRALSVGAAENVHQFGDLAPLFGLIAAGDRLADAMGHVIAQHLFLQAAKGGADRGNLGHDVDAVSVLGHH